MPDGVTLTFEREKTDGEMEVVERSGVESFRNPPSVPRVHITYTDGTSENVPCDHMVGGNMDTNDD